MRGLPAGEGFRLTTALCGSAFGFILPDRLRRSNYDDVKNICKRACYESLVSTYNYVPKLVPRGTHPVTQFPHPRFI